MIRGFGFLLLRHLVPVYTAMDLVVIDAQDVLAAWIAAFPAAC